MASSLGSIPEDFPINGVYECPLVTELPSLIYGMRATFRELIWDAEGGFADDWRDRSSVEGTPEDGYTFRISRRAFSAANMAIFAAGAGSGGGGVSGGATVVLALSPGLNSNVEIPDVATVSVVAATGDTDTVLDSILRPPPAGGGDPEATDYHSVIFVNDQATNSLILRPGKGTPFADLVTPDGEDYVLGPREGAVLVYLHYVSAWTVHPLAKSDDGDALSIHGVSIPALSNGVLTSSGGVLSWSAAAGAGDVMGPASSVADRIATYNGTTGKIIKDGGKTIADVEASAVATAATATTAAIAAASNWKTYCDLNFTQMSSQSGITNGVNTIGGKTLRGGNIVGAATVAIVAGTGLVFTTTTATSNFWYYSGHTAPYLGIDCPVDIPGWIIDESAIRITAEYNLTTGTANFATASFGLSKDPFVSNADWVHMWREVYSGGKQRSCFHLFGSTEDSPAGGANTHNVACVSMRNQHDVRYYSKVWSGLDTVANSTALDLTTMALARVEQYAPAAETLFSPRITNTDHFLAILCAQSGNTSNNTVCTFKRLRIEYKL